MKDGTDKITTKIKNVLMKQRKKIIKIMKTLKIFKFETVYF